MGRLLCQESEYPTPLLTVAGHKLPGTRRSFPSRPLSDGEWLALLEAAADHRVNGLLHAAITEGAFPTTDAQRQQVLAAHRRTRLVVLALEQQLARVADVLADGGVDTRILKGSAVARLDYAEPGVRSFVDLDVLVRGVDIERSVALLTDAGFRRTLAEPRPGFDRRFDKGMTLVAPVGFELDLHRTFVLGPWGAVLDPDELWDDGEPLVVGGRTLRALSRPYRFLHACYHAALGNWPLRLASLRDVAEQLRSGQDEREIQEIMGRWGVQAVVAAAVADTRRLLGTGAADGLSTWADTFRPGRRDEAWLALHTRSDKTFAAQALATLPVLGWGDRVDYLRALLAPDAEYTGDRHRSARARFTYAARQIRQGLRRPQC